MRLRKVLVRQILNLYPDRWQKEYGEEMRSMLLAQPLTASVIGDVFLNAMRQNLRRPDPWRIAFLILTAWRVFWIVWASISQLSPEIWPPFVQVDCAVFLLVAFATGCWMVINEGDVRRGSSNAFVSTMLAADLAPIAATLLLLALAPDKTIPDWASETFDQNQPASIRYSLVISLTRALASLCGALLGRLIRRRRDAVPLNRA